jgi:hypothetical protein
MSVGTFLQPDHETQSGAVYKAAIDNSLAAMSRIAVAFAPHEQDTPAMTVRVDAGDLLVSGAIVHQAAQNSATITAPSGTDHRIDRVVIDSLTGAVSVVAGTPGVEGAVTPPDIPTGKLPVCQVALAHGMTVITNDLITDERILGGGGVEAIKIDQICVNIGDDPATELGYGTWELIRALGIESIYPPAHSGTYVKASYAGGYYPYNATDPANPLTGADTTSWLYGSPTNVRFHIDTGSAQVIRRIYYENYHDSGGVLGRGMKNFTLWGSNSPTAFAELTYGIDTDWTQLTTSQSTFDQHTGSDIADPKYIDVSGQTEMYRYYAIKISDNHDSGTGYIGARRIVLQSGEAAMWLRTA